MIYYERIDKSERINSKRKASECVICHYCIFLMDSNIEHMFVMDVMILV